MITEKDIQTRISEILTDAGFNVVASEVEEGLINLPCLCRYFLRMLNCFPAAEQARK